MTTRSISSIDASTDPSNIGVRKDRNEYGAYVTISTPTRTWDLAIIDGVVQTHRFSEDSPIIVALQQRGYDVA